MKDSEDTVILFSEQWIWACISSKYFRAMHPAIYGVWSKIKDSARIVSRGKRSCILQEEERFSAVRPGNYVKVIVIREWMIEVRGLKLDKETE